MNIKIKEKPFDLNFVFNDPSHLHLICWNLSDIDVHKKGLELAYKLIDDERLFSKMLIMIRPLGRVNLSEYDNAIESIGELGKEGKDYILLKTESDPYYSHCELWIQIASEEESLVWDKLKEWIEDNSHGFARRSFANPLWRPYSSDLAHEDNYYPRYCDEIVQKSAPKFIQNIIPREQIPWFIKLIWGRASYLIVSHFLNCYKGQLINPANNIRNFIDLYSLILANIDMKAYGFTSAYEFLSPMHFGASHMAGFALNALVSDRSGRHQIEQYYPRGFPVTHPYKFYSKDILFVAMVNLIQE